MSTQSETTLPGAPVPFPGEPQVSEQLAATMGVDQSEWQRILKALGREPTYAELGVFSVMWSEHCSYKSSRIHLRKLPTKGPKVVQGPGENAGAVDIGDGYCAVFKMESHNHPSYIEPYQGAATGVGGILRDVFTMGARPVANLNSLRFGRPDHPRTPELLRGVVAGIGGYGNSIGVPTVGGEVQFDASYDGNILVNAFTVGIARSEGLFFGKAEGLGNPVIYVGSRTGRDGIHGATMASAEFDAESEKKLPTVQVGDPFREKLLLEACLEIFAKGCLVGIQDMGAAGLTSSSVEMAARAGNGLELDLDAIPRRTYGLTPYEMLLSESQERMLMVSEAGREEEVFEICRKWDLDYAVVGRVTDTGRFVCKATPGHDPLDPRSAPKSPQVVVDIPIGPLADEAPLYDRPQETPPPVGDAGGPALGDLNGLDLARELVELVGSPNIGSRAWIWRQYDHIVRAGSVFRPGESDAAVVRVFCGKDGDPAFEGAKVKYLALSSDCNGRHVLLDPHDGAAMAVAECARNIVCSGGEPLGLTDCLNFASPQKPQTMWRFARAIEGLRDACTALGVPVVSGNVSLYNETEGRPILPTPTVAIVGQLASVEDRLGLAFANDGDLIAHLGTGSRGALGGSEFRTRKTGVVGGDPVGIDLDAEVKLQQCVLALARAHVLRSAHDLSDGGFAVALTESAIAGGRGCRVTLPGHPAMAKAARLFSEEPTRVIVSFGKEQRAEVERICAQHGVPFEVIGEVGGETVTIEECLEVQVAQLADAHARCLEPIVGS
ncbi:Phosphoribosylformylglycinamidine synthase subunit PurL [Sandaracinus amylolyticus]|nr:phosphoribosylformylglycinamidine synthase subunit PurL [Sandaracinus amylolyticus]UJR81985.1 Phosphoribosylformylglycinamidine synthase subunit PurL [Sandaracinus amylolyticus]